jgi:hypothetical protein
MSATTSFACFVVSSCMHSTTPDTRSLAFA